MDRWERIVNCLSSLWPGLPRLWRHGSGFGLLKALTFGMLLQVAVITTFVWPETIGPMARAVVWFSVFGFWFLFAAPSFVQATRVLSGGMARDSVEDREDLFRQAQREYLRGEWFQSERLLDELLALDAGDSEARLLLATLHRHAERWQAAKEELDRLEEIPGGERWRLEILQERLALVRWKRRRNATGPQESNDVAIDAA